MKIAVILRQVPDVVEELVIAESGRSLAEDEVTYITNEADEHALEQALILKARHGAKVSVLSVGGDEARDALATATAKGAEDAILVPMPFENRGDNHHLAALLTPEMKSAGYDLILTGLSAADQRDAGLAGLLAARLFLPYVGGLICVTLDPSGSVATVRKEFPGGRLGVLEVALPAVLGIQSAEQPPRYVPVSKVSQAKKALQPKVLSVPAPSVAGLPIQRLLKPEAAGKAEMVPGDVEQIADWIVRLLRERGIV